MLREAEVDAARETTHETDMASSQATQGQNLRTVRPAERTGSTVTGHPFLTVDTVDTAQVMGTEGGGNGLLEEAGRGSGSLHGRG